MSGNAIRFQLDRFLLCSGYAGKYCCLYDNLLWSDLGLGHE
jgi:hypothetical protein